MKTESELSGIYTACDLKTNSRINPLGTDKKPVFSWKTRSSVQGARQSAYRIIVARDTELSNVIWDSAKITSDKSLSIAYEGDDLSAMTKYYWQVTLWNESGKEYTSALSEFETGLMGTDESVWNGAQWIASPRQTANTSAVKEYNIEADFTAESGKIGFVCAARNKDNYTLIEIDTDKRIIASYEYCDNAWTTGEPSVTVRGEGLIITEDMIAYGAEREKHHVKISVRGGGYVRFEFDNNGNRIEAQLIPSDPQNQPRKSQMMMFGIKQDGRAIFYNITISDKNGNVYQNDDFSDDRGLLASLGTVKGGRLTAENSFEIINPVPAVTVRSTFTVDKEIKSARLYASARGFYDAYINGEKVNADFYNPGFTDYRLRIQYQTYDVTEKIRRGENIIGAIVGKGYWSGFCGYSGAQIYGTQNAFICQLVINYADGTRDIIVTDKTWEYTDKAPVMDADYLDGETYDARLAPEAYDDITWVRCGVQEWAKEAAPTNGTVKGARFELSAQESPTAKIEKTLVPVCAPSNPKAGHYIYDFGQNMVGTIRLRVKGRRGVSLKIRYGEMCDKDGGLYVANLRTAANTDVYTLSGSTNGEVFIPSFTSHGFRYVEITGNGFELGGIDIVESIEGLVINNLGGVTGEFECSNEYINRLQSNIQWGERGNALLVLTDCPQRNERMGWTGDAQVFAKTGAYNMDMQSFCTKWLRDVSDAQLLYNRYGAVPDTAPLGGDNRANGCAGWGDAAVIVPWEMYMAYGDRTVLEENYETMAKWIEYQSRSDRQNYGMRTVDGRNIPEQSDLADEPFIQVQQRRGDHLAYDITTPYILSATAYAAHVCDIMARIAKILGKAKDADKYETRFEKIKKAFNDAWVKEDGSIGYWGEMSLSASTETSWGEKGADINGNSINATYYSEAADSVNYPSQTAYALAIDFGLIDDDKIQSAGRYLKKAIERNNGLLSVGFLGISHIVPALCKAELYDEAFKLVGQTENPSWLYSVKNGATTIWERWDSYIAETQTFGNVSMNSFNHYSYGAIGEWLFSSVAGINAQEAGYKHIKLTPHFGGALASACAYHESPYGKIKSSWTRRGERLIYSCTIPANTTATLYLPSVNGTVVKELESGSYTFEQII